MHIIFYSGHGKSNKQPDLNNFNSCISFVRAQEL